MKYQELSEKAKERVLSMMRSDEICDSLLLSHDINYHVTMPMLEEKYGFKFTEEEINTMEYHLGTIYSNVPYLKGEILISDKFEKAFVSRATKEQYIMYYHRRFYQIPSTRSFLVEHEGSDFDSGYLHYVDVAEFYNCEDCGLTYSDCKCGVERRDQYQYRETDFENGVEVRLAESVVKLIGEMMRDFCQALLNLIKRMRDERYSKASLIELIEVNEWDFDEEGNIN
jgi:hypothetical protein